MSQFNAYKSVNYLLFLILIITAGCAEQPINHSVFNEAPPSYNQQPYTTKIKSVIRSGNIKRLFVSHNTVWDRLLSLYALPEIKNKRIDQEIQRYLKHPNYLSTIQQRAAPYLYFILDEIESKKIPGELALLPIVESGFNPNAISKSKASGLWQFMPATGRLFGLKQNIWYDGRNDIYTSTQAATTYLKQLSQLFDDDWFLALASYNAGKGTVRKAIRKNLQDDLPTDYWSLPLREETKAYVPRLLAIAKIFANTEKYGISLQHIPNKPHFSVVNIKSQLDLKIASALAGIHHNEFITLNPAFKRGTTAPNSSFHLLIHTDKASIFKKKLARTAKKDRVKHRHRHKVISGENLGLIAKNYHTSIHALRQENSLTNNNIRAGQFLYIPPSSISKSSKAKKQLYIVKKGDTFWEIARQFSVRSKDIAFWNNISLTQVLKPGQKLIIKKS
jgi:membrane-bound lytic murein transglycosylase D